MRVNVPLPLRFGLITSSRVFREIKLLPVLGYCSRNHKAVEKPFHSDIYHYVEVSSKLPINLQCLHSMKLKCWVQNLGA